MKQYIPEEILLNRAEEFAEKYQNTDPFPHIYFDNFFDESDINDVLEAFPSPEEMDFYKYDNPLEKKLAMDQVSKLPDPIGHLLLYLNTPPILKFLEKLTGIENLISDPYYRGGGIHQIPSGGKLDVHIDFNKYTKFDLDRRINLILYLNKDWEESFGGELELWNGFHDGNKHQLTSKATGILPIFNRVAIFNTSEHSYHGHPTPLACPEDRYRRSIALYYYTNGRDDVVVDAHSTTFIALPDEEENKELEALRDKRNKGRLTSNIKS